MRYLLFLGIAGLKKSICGEMPFPLRRVRDEVRDQEDMVMYEVGMEWCH